MTQITTKLPFNLLTDSTVASLAGWFSSLFYTIRFNFNIGVSMMAVSGRQDSAKVFMSGMSQAVRLPKKFRFSKGCDEVAVR